MFGEAGERNDWNASIMSAVQTLYYMAVKNATYNEKCKTAAKESDTRLAIFEKLIYNK